MVKDQILKPHPKYRKRRFKVKETVLTTQPKCMPVNLAEEKRKFMQCGETPQFQLQDPSKLSEVAEKPKNQIRFDLQGEALYILEHVLNEYGDGEAYLEHAFGPRISKEAATPLLLDYIAENSLSESLTIHWCDNLACSAKMMWKGPVVNCNRPDLRKYSLWINGSEDNKYMRESGIRCLMDHEIGTHFFRMLNDGFQPWFSDRAKFDLRRSSSFETKCTEEGLATINTVLRGRVKLLWCAALAYYTACKSAEMTFKQLFDHIGRYTANPNYRWKQVMRVKRGLKDPNDLGGLGNDQCYFEGAVTLLRNLENIDFCLLMSGKICYDELDRIKRVVRKECLRYPSFMFKMAAYKKTLNKIRVINGLHQTHPIQNPPAEYLRRLLARKMSRSYDKTRANKISSRTILETAGSRHKNVQNCKPGVQEKSQHSNDDSISEIKSFSLSNRFVNLHQYKVEETKRNEETCQIYRSFEFVTHQLSTLDAAIEQKIQDLKNIVKEHNWSNSDNEYKENLLNEASCELMLEDSSAIEKSLRTLSALTEEVSVQICPDTIRPKTSLLVLEEPSYEIHEPHTVNITSQTSIANKDFNSNSCHSRYFKRKEKNSFSLHNKQKNTVVPQKTIKTKKKKADELTDTVINERVAEEVNKFMSEVNPHEIIFLEPSYMDEGHSSLEESKERDIIVDIKDDITSEIKLTNKEAKSDASGNISSDHLQADVTKTASSKRMPNFILRNKLLTRRSCINSSSNSDNNLKTCKLPDKNKDNKTDSDSDNYEPRRKTVRKKLYADIVSHYSQRKRVVIQKPKPDREILTADLCKPFFIQAERLLQAEKVLKKTRSKVIKPKSLLLSPCYI